MQDDSQIKKYAQLIEAFLFWKGEPVTIREISKALSIDIKEMDEALDFLSNHEEGRGIVIVRFQDKITLGTHPDTSEAIEALTKDELTRDLGKSALETLAIILYQGPVKRSHIDYIRGVNSQFILRNLLMRGLIDRNVDTQDERAFVYSPSLELLAHLGVRSIKDLPDFETVTTSLRAFEKEE